MNAHALSSGKNRKDAKKECPRINGNAEPTIPPRNAPPRVSSSTVVPRIDKEATTDKGIKINSKTLRIPRARAASVRSFLSINLQCVRTTMARRIQVVLVRRAPKGLAPSGVYIH